MNIGISDDELGRTLREEASVLGFSPEAFLLLAKEAADRQRWSVMPNSSPFPEVNAEEVIEARHLEGWPD